MEEIIDIKNLKNIMKERGLNEKELAELCDISLYKIKKILKGQQKRLSAIVLLNLSGGLKVSPDSLLKKEYQHIVLSKK